MIPLDRPVISNKLVPLQVAVYLTENLTVIHKRLQNISDAFIVPPISSSCPCEPSRVFDRNGAKSTNISLRSGATEPRARSNLSVRDPWSSLEKRRFLYHHE